MMRQQRISWVLLAHATRNSLTPFLYQTRTLLSTSGRPLQQCSPHSTANTNSSAPPPQENSESEKKDQVHPADPDATYTPNKSAPKRNKSYLHSRANSSTPHSASRKTQLTESEKRAFSYFIGKLGEENEAPAQWMPTKPRERSALKEEDQKEIDQVSAIFNSVLQDMKNRQKLPATPVPSGKEKDSEIVSGDVEADLKMQLKLRTLRFTDKDVTELVQSSKISRARAIELVVQREAMKIEKALRKAIEERSGKKAIWDLCQDRIFSMLKLIKGKSEESLSILRKLKVSPDYDETVYPFRFNEHGAIPTTPSPPASKSPSTPTNPTYQHRDNKLSVPRCIAVEAVVTALYPKMLLTAFRLLNVHFPDSDLINEFRSTLRSLGRESAVLGSSTALYNELIYFNWRGCCDMRGVVLLLHEMEVTGVEPDDRTLAMLNAIIREWERDMNIYQRQMHNPRDEAPREPWWDLPPNRKAVRELLGPTGWIQRLENRIQERKAREKLYG